MTEPSADMTSMQMLLAAQRVEQAARRPGLSWSAVGGCRRKAGYLIAETQPSNPGGEARQAALGTSIHKDIAEVGAKLLPDDLFEERVEFAGISGTLDRYHDGRVDDTKTTTQRFLDSIRADGIPLSWRYQSAGYAAGLVVRGYRVHTIRINAIARDTGDEELFERPFHQQEVADALAWVDMVRQTPLDMLNRDYLPTSTFCQSCQFLDICWTNRSVPGRDLLTALWVDDPDAAKWAAELDEARAAKREAEDREKRAKGALDALRPDDGGRIAVPGFERELSWSTTTRRTLDQDAVTAEYAAAGAAPPMRRSESVTLKLVKPRKPKAGGEQ